MIGRQDHPYPRSWIIPCALGNVKEIDLENDEKRAAVRLPKMTLAQVSLR